MTVTLGPLCYFYFGPVYHPASFGLTHTRRGQISRRIPGIQVRYNKSCPQAYLVSGFRIKSYADKKILVR